MNNVLITDIIKYLPHRYPFLLVDRVVDWNKNQNLLAYKSISVNEPFFVGHFPSRPVMPGVMIIEALAQACGMLILLTDYPDSKLIPAEEKPLFFLVGIDDARFKQQVIPGDRLDFNIEVVRSRKDLWKFNCVASVSENLAAQASILIARGS